MTELSLHILDIVQNSIRAKASKIEVNTTEDIDNNQFIIEIEDNGKGMTEAELEEVSSPFYTTRKTRKVGLGISLFKQATELCNGYMEIHSQLNKGTFLVAVFSHNHLDRPILGDIAGTMTLLIGANPEIDFIYTHKMGSEMYKISSSEIRKELDDFQINNPKILKGIKELINENLKEINKKKK